ncbi:MAG: pentapeptide repeat-containing protein, partial [Coxiellaceae bacterium]|nr:pentapeptide repeat-containing protein [Coxiellaceae bacterium]
KAKKTKPNKIDLSLTIQQLRDQLHLNNRAETLKKLFGGNTCNNPLLDKHIEAHLDDDIFIRTLYLIMSFPEKEREKLFTLIKSAHHKPVAIELFHTPFLIAAEARNDHKEVLRKLRYTDAKLQLDTLAKAKSREECFNRLREFHKILTQTVFESKLLDVDVSDYFWHYGTTAEKLFSLFLSNLDSYSEQQLYQEQVESYITDRHANGASYDDVRYLQHDHRIIISKKNIVSNAPQFLEIERYFHEHDELLPLYSSFKLIEAASHNNHKEILAILTDDHPLIVNLSEHHFSHGFNPGDRKDREDKLDLRFANLAKCVFQDRVINCDFSGSILINATFKALIEHCRLHKTTAHWLKFECHSYFSFGANDCENADLSGTEFTTLRVTKTSVKGRQAKQETYYEGHSLGKCVFRGANLMYCDLRYCYLPEDLSRTNFHNALLLGVNFTKQIFDGANLNTQLGDTGFFECDFTTAKLPLITNKLSRKETAKRIELRQRQQEQQIALLQHPQKQDEKINNCKNIRALCHLLQVFFNIDLPLAPAQRQHLLDTLFAIITKQSPVITQRQHETLQRFTQSQPNPWMKLFNQTTQERQRYEHYVESNTVTVIPKEIA